MGLTLSHQSALDALRRLRLDGVDVRNQATPVTLHAPSLWTGERWSRRLFEDPSWHWDVPCKTDPLHVVVSNWAERPRTTLIKAHACMGDIPAGSFVWLDEHTSMVSPGLLFVQMASVLQFSSLVLLGYELCGNFTRDAHDPRNGPVRINVPVAITAEELRAYVQSASGIHGLRVARRAAKLVAGNALSAPEAVIAAMCALPVAQNGYGVGLVELNRRVWVREESQGRVAKFRVPDIMLPIAPVGFNYDGQDHLDLNALAEATLKKVG
ncbi:MAG: hypothetical protein Q4A01_05925 [Coriobacteriales bacterium]|nr:hypothetical protein [Coriobacteriales bacterium]